MNTSEKGRNVSLNCHDVRSSSYREFGWCRTKLPGPISTVGGSVFDDVEHMKSWGYCDSSKDLNHEPDIRE